jgi:signal peptidase II
MGRKSALLLAILAAGVALDQATKLMVAKALPLGTQVPVIRGFFNLVHIHNRGAAFGLLANWSLDVARVFFVLTTSLVLAVVGYLWWRLPSGRGAAALGYSLIMAGALGNLIDRVRLGEVIDFLDFFWGRFHWPAFNVADSLVCMGAGLLVWVILREDKETDVSDPV